MRFADYFIAWEYSDEAVEYIFSAVEFVEEQMQLHPHTFPLARARQEIYSMIVVTQQRAELLPGTAPRFG